FVDGARDAEVGDAVGHARELDADHPRRHEGLEDVPPRARAAEAREADPRAAEALGDVAGDVDADHVEGDALCAWAPECRDPMAHLLEADPEATTDHVDVVTLL